MNRPIHIARNTTLNEERFAGVRLGSGTGLGGEDRK